DVFCLLSDTRLHGNLQSFPTRRSSDLARVGDDTAAAGTSLAGLRAHANRSGETASRRMAFTAPRVGERAAKAIRLLAVSPLLFRSEEHTSELQSRENLVCRLLLEKKKQ